MYLAYIYIETLLSTYGIDPLSPDTTNLIKFKIAGFFNLYLWFTILFCVINITILKETVRRERPKRHEIPYTVYDVAKSEKETYAMPSGDSAAAATWCVMIGFSL